MKYWFNPKDDRRTDHESTRRRSSRDDSAAWRTEDRRQDPPEYRVLDWVISLDKAFEEYKNQEGGA